MDRRSLDGRPVLSLARVWRKVDGESKGLLPSLLLLLRVQCQRLIILCHLLLCWSLQCF